MSTLPYIPSWFIESGFNHHQLAIMAHVACRGKCFESKKAIWTKLKMGEKTYRRTIKELTEAGWIKQSWIKRKRCLEITGTGKHMDILKFEKQSYDRIKEQSYDRIKEQSGDCTNLSREPINITNQVKTVTVQTGTVQGRDPWSNLGITGKPLQCPKEEHTEVLNRIFNGVTQKKQELAQSKQGRKNVS